LKPRVEVDACSGGHPHDGLHFLPLADQRRLTRNGLIAFDREMNRRFAVVRRHVDVGAAIEQQPDDGKTADAYRLHHIF
jgi:hypothetical protein